MYPEELAYRFNEARSQEIGQKLVSGIHNSILSMSKKAESQRITEQRIQIRFFQKGKSASKVISIKSRGIRKR